MAQTDPQDRTKPASPRRLQKAREEGQVARSRDLGHLVMMTAGVGLVAMAAPWLASWVQQLLTQGLRFDSAGVRNPAFMGERLVELSLLMLWVVLPFGLCMVGAAVLSGVALSGWNWSLKALTPQLSKLNPFTGLMGLLSKQKVFEALKASTLAVILGCIGAFYLREHIEEWTSLLAMPLPQALSHAARTLLSGLVLLLLALAAFALMDVPLQKFFHAQRLKMSHAEVKQEGRELEGNPEIKAKLKARMREGSRRRMLAAVPTADLVVMNPTHYAVALKYDDGRMGAPRVVAKGADLLALKIRDTATESKVPVLQAPALARALYAHAELDREIPAALFAAVAQVLAYVYQLRAALAGQVPMPGALPELKVPLELDPQHAGGGPGV
jgi:flagellar biosynthesis protein FlhB